MIEVRDRLWDEASIDDIKSIGSDIHFFISDIYLTNYQFTKATIIFSGVNSIEKEGISVNSIAMEGEYGEILAYKTSGNSVNICIEWCRSRPAKDETYAYKIYFDRVEYEISDERYTID